jgi:tetrahydromethanopterin S-methyltransferase subunit G
MALTPEESNELKKQLQEIERLSRLLNKNIDTTSLQNLERQAGNIKILFQSLTDEFNDLTGEIGHVASGFKKLVQEITNANIGVKETTKAFSRLSSISEKIQSYQRGFSDLTTKDIKKLREQFDIEKQRLVNAQGILKDKKDLLEVEKRQLEIQKRVALQNARIAQGAGDRAAMSMAISQAKSLENRIRKINGEYGKASGALTANKALLEEHDILLKGLDVTIKQTNEDLENQNKLLGLSGAIIGSLQEGLNKLGFGGLARQLGIEEASQRMKDFSRQIIEDRKKELLLIADIKEANVKNLSAEKIRKGLGGDVLRLKQKELDALVKSNDGYKGINGKLAVLKEGVRSMGKSLIDNLKDPLTIATFTVTQLIDALKSVDGGTGQMAKDLNLSYAGASNLRDELNTIANLSMDNAVNTQGLQESYTAISKALGANVDINKEDLKTFTKLREQAGYTNEELIAINKISMGTGESVDDTVSGFFAGAKALSAQKGVAINVKQLLKETANVSNAIKLSLGGSTEALGKAAAQAKAVGMNLEQADRIASSLLNFEDSISAELEAELLTGKNINLEKARLAAINGNIGEVAEEINKQLGGSAEFTKMNRLQQEAMAKAVGMTREELANSLVEQEALQRTGFKTAEAAKARYEELRKTMSAEEAAAALGDEELAKQYEQQGVQERFNQTVEKLKEIFVSAATALMPVFDIFSEILGVVGPIAGAIGQMVKWTIQLGKYLLPIYGLYQGIRMIQQSSVTASVAQYTVTKLQKNEDMGINAVKIYRNKIEDEGIAKRIVYNAQLMVGLIREQGINGLKTFAATLDEKSLSRKIVMTAYDTAAFVRDKASLVIARLKAIFSKQELVTARAGNALSKKGLATDTGSAATSALKMFSGLGPVGWALGLAAAASAVALGMKFMNYGDDVVSKPGYGNRTLMGPEGAIQLNNKDTVIAGTDLFSGENTSSTPQSSGGVDMSGVRAELQAIKNLLQQIASSPGVVELDGTLVGKVLTPLINTENLTTSVKTQ